MEDPRSLVEAMRLKLRLSQLQLGAELGISQAHYSKVRSGLVPLSDKLKQRMDDWLAKHERTAPAPHTAYRMQALAASIRRQCMELMHLSELALKDAPNS